MSTSNRRLSARGKASFGRRSQARRSHAILEALEIRRLLSGYAGYTFTLANQGSSTANGTYLQDLIYGKTTITGDGVTNHTLTLGDTLILPDGYDYDMGGSTTLDLPNLGAAATATESGGAVTSLSLTFAPAGGYSAAPTVSIFGGGGSGATGTVTYNSTTGAVTGISLTGGGSGYTAAPTVAIQGGAEALTIESSGYNAGELGSGRFNPATDESYVAQISSSFINGVMETVLSDSYNHSGAAQNYAFDGIEMAMDSATNSTQVAMINIGTGVAQDYDQLVPNNFTFNQDYIHGGALGQTSDDLNNAALEVTVIRGMELNANYVTVENSQISDIHSASNNGGGDETQAIGGYNLMGNFTINNNYLEATGESILFGGAENYLPSPAQANNLTITNNFFTKNPAWNPALPQYAGVPMVVKNDLELKTGTNVTISENIFQNVWVGADQRGQAINLSNLDTDKMDPWYNDANISITDNVFRNVGMIIDLSAGLGDTVYNPSDGDAGYSGLTNNVTIENNLAYDIGGWQWAYDGGTGDTAMWITSGTGGPSYNVTFENNTIIGTDGIFTMSGPSGLTDPATSNLICENNVLDESVYGIASSAGTDNGTLNSVETAALTITNPGSGYTAAPTVTISGGGGSGATATAYVWPATEGGLICPFAGQLMYVQITNYGSGYTANPTVTFNNTGTGGSGAAASAIAESDDQIHGYTFTHNVIIGGSSSNYPAGNYFPATQNLLEMLDPAGDEYGILSTSSYYADGTGGSVPGVNMATLTPGGSSEWIPADSANALQNYYKFDEGSGTTAHDNGLGTHENGTINGTYAWSTSGPTGGGISFTGSTSGNVSVSNFSADASFTFAAWVNPTNFSATQYIASTKNSSSVSAFSLSLNTSGKLVATGTTGSVTANTALTAGQWSLVSVTYNSGTLTLYLNGADIGSAASATTTTGTTTLYIGGNEGSVSSFNGTLDEVRYYSASLAQTSSVVGNNYLGRAGGSGYNTSTNGTAVTFSGGGGTGAAATAYAENIDGVITSIIMTNSGSGYTAAPTMSFGSTGSGAADTATMASTPLSYLYAQSGPQFAETTGSGESNIVKGTTTTLTTDVVTPDEVYSAATYDWSVVTWPSDVGKPTLSGTTNGSTVTFSGAGSYLFQCVVTNSVGQSATVDYPVTVFSISNTNVAFVSPPSVTLPEKGTQAFTVNGTSIANLGNTITDQFGNPMPSDGWSWSLDELEDGTITSAGLYTAPNTVENLGSVVHLNYTTPDGVSYQESSAAVNVTGTAPNVPTSVTATSSGIATSIAVNWSESSTGTIYYDVQRSTNDSSWTTIASGLTSTSYNDTSGATGTVYYYEVNAYYTSSSPSAWSSAASAGTMSAYEGFAYATGNGQKWQGANGGIGWGSAWSVGGTNDTSIVAGLSYTSGSSSLTTSGNAAQLISGQGASRTLASSIGATGTTLWVGALMNLHESSTQGTVLGAALDLGITSGASSNALEIGAPINGDISAYVTMYPYTASLDTGIPVVANQTYLVVAEIQYLTSGDIISIYEDPTLVTQPSSATAVLTLPSSKQFSATSLLSLSSPQVYTTSQWDEIRLGPTFASVTADPPVVGSNASGNNSSHGHRKGSLLTFASSASTDIVTRPANAAANHFYPGLNGSVWQFTNNDPDNALLASPSVINSWKGLFN